MKLTERHIVIETHNDHSGAYIKLEPYVDGAITHSRSYTDVIIIDFIDDRMVGIEMIGHLEESLRKQVEHENER